LAVGKIFWDTIRQFEKIGSTFLLQKARKTKLLEKDFIESFWIASVRLTICRKISLAFIHDGL
jgi:hypothetical protein